MFKKKEIEKEVAEPKAKPAAAVIEGMPDPLMLLSLDGEILSVNSAHLKLFGHKSPDEITGKSFEKLLNAFVNPEEDIPRMLELFGEVLEKGFVERPIELKLQRPDGTRQFIVSAFGSLIRDADGKPVNVVAVLRDITELKRLQEKEAAADREKAEVVNAMPDPLFVVSLEGVILSTNPAHTRVFGRKPEEIIGKSFDELVEAIKPEDIGRFVKLLGELVETGKTAPIETVIYTKDNKGIPTSVAYSLVKDAAGNPKNIVAVLRDITELKRLQEKEKEVVADKARAEEAEKYGKELEAKVKELEEFHDLAVGRELKMKKMEEEMEELKKRLERREK